MRKAKKDRLELFPESGWVVEDCPIPGVLEIVFGQFRIFYRIIGSRVILLTIFRGARNPDWRQLESE